MRCCNCNTILSDVTSAATSIICDYCGINHKLTIENIETMTMGVSNNRLKEEILNIEIGSTAIFTNEDHILHGQKINVINKKHKFVKIGMPDALKSNQTLWVPNEWVKSYETN